MIYRLENNEFLWFLLLIPFLVGIWFVSQFFVKRRIGKLGNAQILSEILPFISTVYAFFKYSLIILSVLFLVLALTNPQTGQESMTSRTVGFEVNMVVDVSNSMLAEDIKPNRLDAVRKVLYKLINGLKDSRIGVTVFAGEAFNQIPPTSDENILEAVLTTLSPEMIPTQGSDLGKALEIALQNFNFEETNRKFIIVLTDGEMHEGDFMSSAKKAVEQGVTIHVLGVGTAKGSPVPVSAGNGRRSFLKDKDGRTVISVLNEASLQALAQEGQGLYASINNPEEIKRIVDSINGLEKRVVTEKIYSEYSSYFSYLIAVSLFLILLEFVLPKHKLLKKEIEH